MDLIKTIEDDEEVEILSEDSDAEVEVRTGKASAEQRFYSKISNSVSTNEEKATGEEGLRE